MEGLEHEAELLRADAVETADLGIRRSVENHVAGGRPVERAKQIQQRRFSAAAVAHDGHVFAAADRDVHVLDGVDLSVGIELREPFGAEQSAVAAGVAQRGFIHGEAPP